MSIRLRLTLLYSVILALTLALFGGLLYTIQARQTLSIVEQDLVQVAKSAAKVLTNQHRLEGWPGSPGTVDAATSASSKAGTSPWPVAGLVVRRDLLGLLAADGTRSQVTIEAQFEDLPLSAAGLAQLQAGEPWTEIAEDEQGRILIYNEPLLANGELAGIVQVARSLADRDRSLRSLGIALVSGSALMTAVAFGIGWALASLTLQPIHRITASADEIGRTRDFGSRVPYDGPNDELGRLATTFNGMLARLQDAFQRVAHALDVQKSFVADVSHELRTPLTTIRGNLALLQCQPSLPPEEQADIVDDLRSESNRLIRLTSDLLTLARADAGRTLSRERVDVGVLAQEVCRQTHVLEPEREIACRNGCQADAMGDADALKQVLLILLDNAVKHATGPIAVQVRETDRHIEVDVQDSGPGMSPTQQASIFRRFYRGDSSRSTPGFGLGLPIAQELTEAQGGVISLQSAEGEGSTFTVRVPRAAS